MRRLKIASYSVVLLSLAVFSQMASTPEIREVFYPQCHINGGTTLFEGKGSDFTVVDKATINAGLSRPFWQCNLYVWDGGQINLDDTFDFEHHSTKEKYPVARAALPDDVEPYQNFTCTHCLLDKVNFVRVTRNAE